MISLTRDTSGGYDVLTISTPMWCAMVLHLDRPACETMRALVEIDGETGRELTRLVPLLGSDECSLRSALRAEGIGALTAPGHRWCPMEMTCHA
ncbi:MAG: hypothetical protein KF847_19860 [Pirellulales bacterium]|nr:hypothetical protein [Pirellulales bacterium]